MAATTASSRSSPSLDVENDASDSSFPSDLATPLLPSDLATPLLPTDLPPSAMPDKSLRRSVIIMSFLFIGLVEIYAFITVAPIQEIMEDFICGSHYPDHVLGQPRVQDERCKGDEVQSVLAMVRSWIQSCGLFVPLLVQIPYGIIADKYGRRPVLFLSLVGILLECIWTMLILSHPSTFTVYSLIYGGVAFLIGGGAPTATAMIFTILCDVVPASERTSVFYNMVAFTLVLEAVLNPLSGWLMSFNPWIPMWIGAVSMALGAAASLLVPETLTFRKVADSHATGAESEPLLPQQGSTPANKGVMSPMVYVRQLLSSAKQNTSHIYRFLLASPGVMLLVIAYGLTYPIRSAYGSLMLQYISKRFHWSWSTATYNFTVAKIFSVLTLLVLLPLLCRALPRRIREHPLRRDLLLSRVSILFVLAACLLVAFAPVPAVLILGFIAYGLGSGLPSQIRALATGVIEPHTVATLTTMISSMEALAGLVSAPVLGWLLSCGLKLGDAWMGLPFLVLAGTALFVFLCVWMFRIPEQFL